MNEAISVISDTVSILILAWGLLAWLRDKRKLMSPISLILFCDAAEVVIPYKILRRDLTRQEVAGVLGLFSGGRRFSLPGLSGVFSKGEYKRVLQGKSDTLRIPAPLEEFAAFKAVIDQEEFNKTGN